MDKARFNFAIDRKLKDNLEEFAWIKRTSKAQIIQEALKYYMDNQGFDREKNKMKKKKKNDDDFDF